MPRVGGRPRLAGEERSQLGGPADDDAMVLIGRVAAAGEAQDRRDR